MEVQYGGHHEINGNMKTDKMCNQVIFRAADPGFFFSSRSFSSPLSFTRSLNDSSFFFFFPVTPTAWLRSPGWMA